LDIVLREDASRVKRTTDGLKNLGILRRVALNLKKRESTEKGNKKHEKLQSAANQRIS
jgi:hypothetical protein